MTIAGLLGASASFTQTTAETWYFDGIDLRKDSLYSIYWAQKIGYSCSFEELEYHNMSTNIYCEQPDGKHIIFAIEHSGYSNGLCGEITATLSCGVYGGCSIPLQSWLELTNDLYSESIKKQFVDSNLNLTEYNQCFENSAGDIMCYLSETSEPSAPVSYMHFAHLDNCD